MRHEIRNRLCFRLGRASACAMALDVAWDDDVITRRLAFFATAAPLRDSAQAFFVDMTQTLILDVSQSGRIPKNKWGYSPVHLTVKCPIGNLRNYEKTIRRSAIGETVAGNRLGKLAAGGRAERSLFSFTRQKISARWATRVLTPRRRAAKKLFALRVTARLSGIITNGGLKFAPLDGFQRGFARLNCRTLDSWTEKRQGKSAITAAFLTTRFASKSFCLSSAKTAAFKQIKFVHSRPERRDELKQFLAEKRIEPTFISLFAPCRNVLNISATKKGDFPDRKMASPKRGAADFPRIAA